MGRTLGGPVPLHVLETTGGAASGRAAHGVAAVLVPSISDGLWRLSRRSSVSSGRQRPARTQVGHPHVVSACAGAEIPKTPTLSIAVTTIRPTLRILFVLTSVPSLCSPDTHCEGAGDGAGKDGGSETCNAICCNPFAGCLGTRQASPRVRRGL